MRGSFSNRDVGIKVPPPCLLEGMLRVRERLGESSRVCVPAPCSALHSGRRDAGSVAPGSASVGISGGCGSPLRVSLSGGAARVFSELHRVHFADGGVGVLSARSVEKSFAFKVTPSAEEHAVLPRVGLVSHATAGESERIIGLRESDFSSSDFAHLIIREFMVCHPVSALALFLALLLVFLLLLLCLVLVPRVVHCLLLLCHACLWMIHFCMMHGIQGVLVVCCQLQLGGG